MSDRVVCISGTSRPDNYTCLALRVVADVLRGSGCDVTLLDGREIALAFPGQPETEGAIRLREALGDAQGVVLATPEYHGSLSAYTKLVIENLGFPSELGGKPVALLGIADGRLGAVKSLEQLRSICAHVGAIVLPRAISIAGVSAAFDAAGECTDDEVRAALERLANSLVGFLDEYVRPRQVLEEMVRTAEPETWVTSV